MIKHLWVSQRKCSLFITQNLVYIGHICFVADTRQRMFNVMANDLNEYKWILNEHFFVQTSTRGQSQQAVKLWIWICKYTSKDLLFLQPSICLHFTRFSFSYVSHTVIQVYCRKNTNQNLKLFSESTLIQTICAIENLKAIKCTTQPPTLHFDCMFILNIDIHSVLCASRNTNKSAQSFY